jgi:1-deoxy-D-xylulose-5-phosphate reductoisomerase
MLPRLDRPVRSHRGSDHPRGLAVLGATGSIGIQTLEIARLFPEHLAVTALAAGNNWTRLAEQAREFRPEVVAIGNEEHGPLLREALRGTGTTVLTGEEGLAAVATHETADVVVAAIVGFAGMRPTVAALSAGKEIALANKETLVVAGEIVRRLAEAHETSVIPVDSEHSAIFQCLVGEDLGSVESITLTASGGPFRSRPAGTFDTITAAEALQHPNWDMGAKITIDSATMMNKGLEVIEAHWLFGLDSSRIDVLVHPQSIVHSLVSFADGSVKAQLGVPDMRVPIQYALSFPRRWPASHPRVDLSRLASLDFEQPDLVRFPCLRLAYEALGAGGISPAVLNAANEVAVELFLRDEIRFSNIARLVEETLARVSVGGSLSLDLLQEADERARAHVRELHTTITV